MGKVETINLLKEIQSQFGNNIDCQKIIDKLIGNRFLCPQCHGKGVIYQKRNTYPTNLPDSGWGERWEYIKEVCPLCKGEGYTEDEYKPRLIQDGWIKK